MQVKLLNKEKGKVKIEVTVSADDIEKYFDKVVKSINERETFSGFRKGHAPRKIVEAKIGTEKFHAEVIKVALEHTYVTAIEQTKITPIATPKIQVTKFAPGNPLVYIIEVSIFPEVKLGNYKSIKIKKPAKAKVKDSEVEKILLRLQKQMAQFTEKKTTVAKGDKVEVDFTGFIEDVPREDLTSRNHPLIIGEKVFIPEFEEKLIGMKPGEEKEFEISFKKDYPVKHLAGKIVKFKVKLNRAFKVILKPIDDNFAKKINPKFNLKTLKENIKKNLQQQKNQDAEITFKSKVIEAAANQASVEIPQDLINEEADAMIQETAMKLAQQGSSLDQYLQKIDKSKEELKKEWLKEAEKRVKIGLVIAQIAKKENVQVDPKEIDAEMQKQLFFFAQTNPGNLDKIKEQMSNPRARKQMELNLRNRKTIDKLAEYAKK